MTFTFFWRSYANFSSGFLLVLIFPRQKVVSAKVYDFSISAWQGNTPKPMLYSVAFTIPFITMLATDVAIYFKVILQRDWYISLTNNNYDQLKMQSMKTQDVRMSVTKEEERQMERVNIVLKIIRIDSYLHAIRLDVHCTLYSVTFLWVTAFSRGFWWCWQWSSLSSSSPTCPDSLSKW